jgi:hypothetical protein
MWPSWPDDLTSSSIPLVSSQARFCKIEITLYSPHRVRSRFRLMAF